mgnify:FL=1|tara:strand:+ start:25 stop:855 length:831 start_codon:yes stop_codon:yes gene_type:complete
MPPNIITALLLHAATAVSTAVTTTTQLKGSTGVMGFTGVRFSLYPKVAGEASLKAAIKTSVAGLKDLGLEVRPDDVSTALLGPEAALFEAMRAAFGRAVRLEGEPHVSMVCTFSAGCPGEPDDAPLPERTLGAPDEWIADASLLPARVACQYAIYPLGSADYMATIREVIALARRSPAFGAKKLDADGNVMPAGKTHFCTMLDGEGQEVFDVLRSSFALARERSGHVVMTATITANQKKWKPAPEPQLSRAESSPAVDGLPFYDSIEDLLGELDMW